MPINSFLYPGVKVPPAFEVANSCRFNENEYLVRDKATATNVEDFTISVWVKRSVIEDKSCIISSWGGDSNNTGSIYFTDGDKLTFEAQTSSSYSANGGVRKITTQVFRDVNSWSHLVFQKDDGVYKIYHNGTEITDFDTNTQSSGTNVFNNASGNTTIGLENLASAGHPFKGYITEAVLIDGQALAPTSFGEFDEDSPTIWKPKDVSGLTFGNNGFYLDFEDSSNLGNDASGGTDFTSNNLAATDQSTDTCTNNYSTIGSLFTQVNSPTYSEGNLQSYSNAAFTSVIPSSMGFASGKWYVELKYAATTSNDNTGIGIGHDPTRANQANTDQGGYSINYYASNGYIDLYGSNGGTFSTYTVGDIIGIYMDIDNQKLYFSKNGTLQNSGTGLNITTSTTGFYYFQVADFTSTSNYWTWQWNFGAGCPFTISSGNTDDNGHGNFEYSPNITGDSTAKKFYACNTKNLAEFG